MGFFEKWFRRIPTATTPSTLPWVQDSTRCLNAYRQRDYGACVAAGRAALSHELLPTVGAITILGLRRLGQADEAEALSRELLARGMKAGQAGATFLMFMMILDGALDPELFLREHFFGGTKVEITPDLSCQVHFYWGARLLTEGRSADAIRPLRLAAETECKALEARMAYVDLQTAEEQTAT